MVGSFRPMVLGLTCALAASTLAAHRVAADPPRNAPGTSVTVDRSASFGLPGEDPPPPFVPVHPRTVEDQRQIEAVRDYSVARALEDQKNVVRVDRPAGEALKLEPDSIAILRRLSRLCFGRGETEQALRYSKRVLETDPGDTDTISRLVVHYLRKNDPAGAESVLKDVLANPKLDKHARAGCWPSTNSVSSTRASSSNRSRRPTSSPRSSGSSMRRLPTGSRRTTSPHPGGRRGRDIPRIRRCLPEGQAVRPRHQGLRARARLQRG